MEMESRRSLLALALTLTLSGAGSMATVGCGSHQSFTAADYSPGSQYYVATWGDDTKKGSINDPWRTIQKAVDTAEPGSTILVKGGTFGPFAAHRPNLTVTAAPGEAVVIQGNADVRDVALLAADNLTLSNVSIAGCVPKSNPAAFEDDGSSGVRINDGTTGVTVTGVTVRDSHGTNAEGLPFGCYGVMVHNAKNATIASSDLYHNGEGVFVKGGQNTRIIDNQIHDNDTIIRNTRSDDDSDYGAVAVAFVNVMGGALAQNNNLYNNSGPSIDYGVAGGAFDIYQSSNITMVGNVISNNMHVLETGTEGPDCVNNIFDKNSAVGRSGDSSLSHSLGFILRCAHGMQIANNTLNQLDNSTFEINTAGKFGGNLAGLSITNNNISQSQYEAYDLGVNPAGLGINIDHNKYHTVNMFAHDWNSNPIVSLSDWQRITGFDTNSVAY
jgi:hypothetical protein